ncbi:hypothetical protein K505DRAFT_287768, partial [Melanomma pulvis-pyrius CBS 109.77]
MESYTQSDVDVDAKQWARFVDVADPGAVLKKECIAPLTKVSGYWGNEKVRHYQWASKGAKYCKVLGTAASRNPGWGEASIKLNQILLKRITGGHSLRISANPLDLIDLKYLKTWQNQDKLEKKGSKGFTLRYQPISNSDLPAGYTLDQYGLIVSRE